MPKSHWQKQRLDCRNSQLQIARFGGYLHFNTSPLIPICKLNRQSRNKKILAETPVVPDTDSLARSNKRTDFRATQVRSSSPRPSSTEAGNKKRNADVFYYAFKSFWSFQVKCSWMFSLDCQGTPVRKPHALWHNKQPLLKSSAPRKNHTPRPRAGWSVVLMLKSFWQGREHGQLPGTQIK